MTIFHKSKRKFQEKTIIFRFLVVSKCNEPIMHSVMFADVIL